MLELAAKSSIKDTLDSDLKALGALHSIAINQRSLKRKRKGLGDPSGGLTDEQIDVIFKNTINEMIAVTFKTAILSEALSIPTGFLGDFLFDTNSNPSNLKTLGTLISASIINGLVSGGYFLYGMSSAIPDALTVLEKNVEKSVKDIKVSSIDSFTQSTKKLVEEGLLTSEQVKLMGAIYNTALKRYETYYKIIFYAEGAAHLLNAYHGYRRHEGSIGYGLLWGLGGSTALGVALGQGYAKPLSEVEKFKKST